MTRTFPTYDKAKDCGKQSHLWRVPIEKGETHTRCSRCGKQRRKVKR